MISAYPIFGNNKKHQTIYLMLYYWINNWIYYLLFPSGSLIIAYSIVNILHCQYKNHAVMHYMWVMLLLFPHNLSIFSQPPRKMPLSIRPVMTHIPCSLTLPGTNKPSFTCSECPILSRNEFFSADRTLLCVLIESMNTHFFAPPFLIGLECLFFHCHFMSLSNLSTVQYL